MTDTIQQFDYDVNLLQALLWQYDSATNLQGLLEAKDAWYAANQTAFWQDWYTNVFNLATADQFGLIVWGIILGLPLYVNSAPYDGPVFSFDAPVGFDQGMLGSENGTAYMLPVETQRLALQLRYFQLTSSGTVPEINRMLAYVFADFGKAWLLDYGDMTQAYVFDFPVTFDLQYLFNNYDVLPRPAGVASSYIDNTLKYFGFGGTHFNFDNGNIFG